MLPEYTIYRGYIQNAIGPKIELFQRGCIIEALAGFFIGGTETFDKQAFQDSCGFFGFAFKLALVVVIFNW